MYRDDLRKQFQEVGPWTTKYVLGDDNISSGTYDAIGDERPFQFLKAFPRATSILEPGSFEGGLTMSLARNAGYFRVVGVEGREENLRRARLLQKVERLGNVCFIRADVESFDFTSLGRFDAAFVVGILYHLTKPWDFLNRLREVTDKLFLWTHYTVDPDVEVNGYHGFWYPELGLADPLSGLSPRSFWPTLPELGRMLADAGFSKHTTVAQGRQNGWDYITMTAEADPLFRVA